MKKLEYIHWLRGFAMIYIVIWHSLTQTINFSMGVEKFLLVMLYNGTALFVFISGFLFNYLSDRYSYVPYIKKKIQFVVFPYLIASIPGLIWRLAQMHHGVLPTEYVPSYLLDKPFLFVVWSIMTGFHIGPFWFVPFVTLMFLFSPVFYFLSKSKYLILVTILALTVSLYTFRPQYNLNPIFSFIHFVGYYLLGLCACRYKDNKLLDSKGLLVFVIFAVGLLSLFEIKNSIPFSYSFQDQLHASHWRFNINAAQKIGLCILYLMAFKMVDEHKFKFFPRRTLSLIADYSFGIYFVHHYFMMVIGEVIKHYPSMQVEFSSKVIVISLPHFIISMILSMSLIYLVKKITKNRSRYFVGV